MCQPFLTNSLIRAGNAEEAASQAQQFGSDSWNHFGLCVEVVRGANQDGKKEGKEARSKDRKHGKSLKEVIIQRNPEMRKYVDLDEDEIPF